MLQCNASVYEALIRLFISLTVEYAHTDICCLVIVVCHTLLSYRSVISSGLLVLDNFSAITVLRELADFLSLMAMVP